MSTPPQEASRIAPTERQASELLELFYPVHYRGNMALEDAMRGELTRKQAAIMWLIRSEGGSSRAMRRKDIFRKLGELHYSRYVAMEFHPLGDPVKELREARELAISSARSTRDARSFELQPRRNHESA